MNTLDEKLEDILLIESDINRLDRANVIIKLKSLFQEEWLDLIGEDEEFKKNMGLKQHDRAVYIGAFKQELRQKVKEKLK